MAYSKLAKMIGEKNTMRICLPESLIYACKIPNCQNCENREVDSDGFSYCGLVVMVRKMMLEEKHG